MRKSRRVVAYGAVFMALAGIGGERIVVARKASSSGPPSSRCIPSTLNRSAVLPGTTLAVAPLPYSYDASPRTQISLLGVPAARLRHVSVKGSRTGTHAGRLRAYSQGDGASFVPSKPFQSGETVTIRGTLAPGAGAAPATGAPLSGGAAPSAAARPFSFSFVVAAQDTLAHPAPGVQPAGKAGEVQHFHSRPDLQPPAVTVSASSALSAPGYVLAAPYSGPGQDGPMIFDSSGQLVWFDPIAGGGEASDLQVQQLDGKPVLTWWQGYIPPQGFGEGVEVIADAAYHQQVVHAGNGYVVDLHDFHITPQGTALTTVFNPIDCDLSSVGGSRTAAVTDGVYQEIDLRTGLVRREWHSVDHVALSESYAKASQATREWPFDYFHINSLDAHADGTLLLSARNTSALYELAWSTGQLSARIGGRRSSVKMGTGTSMAYQHDARELPNGTISVFDNGGVPKVHPQSRGIVVAVNSQAHTDTLLAQFEHPKALLAGSQGNIELLPNGNYFVGWGAEPYFSEYSSSGQLLFDAHVATKNQSYRGFREPWTGTPPGAPAIAATPTSASGPVNVYASWNGATQVASWRVLGGASASSLAPVASAPRAGFETTIATPGPEAFVAVQALDVNGAVLGTSHAVKG